eukprot:NODE_1243_length_2549_cov_7.808423.p1 GENE.NODE_1243_length_2549_cov_7.808423~~NODE_1243_length_2549_cov_7.808423.p1  ORF type:complete len:603 (+),score=129.57 NODE_1243_length_2549_cov_7.808423:689-2497(+)
MLLGAQVPEGPIARVSGVAIGMYTDCRNDYGSSAGVELEEEVVCAVSFRRLFRQWPRFTRLFNSGIEGVALERKYYGIQIEAFSTAVYSLLHPYNIYLLLVSSLVVLRLPQLVLQLFTTRCLGEVSQIYRRAVYEPCCIPDDLAAAATTIITSHVMFTSVQDTPTGISRPQFAKLLGDAMAQASDNLSADELKGMTAVCFERIVHEGSKMQHLTQKPKRTAMDVVSDYMKETVTTLTGGSSFDDLGCPAEAVNAMSFMHIALLSARCRLHNLIRILDLDRPIAFLERAFTPLALRDLRNGAKRWADESAQVDSLMQASVSQAVIPRRGNGESHVSALSSIELACVGTGQDGVNAEELSEEGDRNEDVVPEMSRIDNLETAWEALENLRKQLIEATSFTVMCSNATLLSSLREEVKDLREKLNAVLAPVQLMAREQQSQIIELEKLRSMIGLDHNVGASGAAAATSAAAVAAYAVGGAVENAVELWERLDESTRLVRPPSPDSALRPQTTVWPLSNSASTRGGSVPASGAGGGATAGSSRASPGALRLCESWPLNCAAQPPLAVAGAVVPEVEVPYARRMRLAASATDDVPSGAQELLDADSI